MDPITISQIIVTVAKAAGEYQKNNDFSEWRNNVDEKLNQILHSTEQILKEFRDFRVQIEINLDDRFRSYFLAGLSASISDLGNVLAGVPKGTKPNAQARENIYTHADRLRNVMKQSLAYGFASIPAALAGYCALLPAMRIAKVSQSEIDDTRRSLTFLVFGSALDPEHQGSFAWALELATKESSDLRRRVSEGMRPTTVGLIRWVDPTYIPNSFEKKNIPLTPYTISAAITEFHGSPDSPESIGASEIVTKIVKDQTIPNVDYFNNMVNFSNVQPPAIPEARRALTMTDAETVRRDWIDQYVSWSKRMLEEEKIVASLSRFVSEARALTS